MDKYNFLKQDIKYYALFGDLEYLAVAEPLMLITKKTTRMILLRMLDVVIYNLVINIASKCL